jgi:hypothetical protein
MTSTKHRMRSMRTLVLVLLWGLLPAACGDGGVVLLSFSSGTVVGDANCRDGAGDFSLRDQGGLLLLIVIGSDTTIVRLNGSKGDCTDVRAGAMADVRGVDHGGRISAQNVTLR